MKIVATATVTGSAEAPKVESEPLTRLREELAAAKAHLERRQKAHDAAAEREGALREELSSGQARIVTDPLAGSEAVKLAKLVKDAEAERMFLEPSLEAAAAGVREAADAVDRMETAIERRRQMALAAPLLQKIAACEERWISNLADLGLELRKRNQLIEEVRKFSLVPLPGPLEHSDLTRKLMAAWKGPRLLNPEAGFREHSVWLLRCLTGPIVSAGSDEVAARLHGIKL